MGSVQGGKAAAYIWSGMFIIGGADNLIPLMAPDTSLWMFHALRSAMVLLILLIVGVLLGWRFWPRRAGRASARNLALAVAMFLYFGSLAFVPIGVAVAGLFTAPIFVLLLSVLFRGVQVGPVRWVAVALGFFGVVLVIQPGGGLGWAAVIPVIGGIFYAIGALATRSWCEGEDTIALLFSYFMVIGSGGLLGMAALAVWPVEAAPGAAGFVARGWVAPDGGLWLLLIVQAIASVIGVGCLTRGYQIGEATYVAINEYALILFASAFAWVFLDQALGKMALSGMALIIGAGVVIALRSDRT